VVARPETKQESVVAGMNLHSTAQGHNRAESGVVNPAPDPESISSLVSLASIDRCLLQGSDTALI
jgi:hypothetical protein